MNQTIFLIERSTQSGPQWLTIYPAAETKIQDSRLYGSWGPVAHFALKFADKESAEAYIRFHSPSADCFASAHSFEKLSRETVLRPAIVCLCGSTRFMDAFQEANLRETLAGRIVLSVGCNTKSDSDLLKSGELTEEVKVRLDALHKRKIDLADEILVLNVGGYIGESTKSEIAYANEHGKVIRWLEATS